MLVGQQREIFTVVHLCNMCAVDRQWNSVSRVVNLTPFHKCYIHTKLNFKATIIHSYPTFEKKDKWTKVEKQDVILKTIQSLLHVAEVSWQS